MPGGQHDQIAFKTMFFYRFCSITIGGQGAQNSFHSSWELLFFFLLPSQMFFLAIFFRQNFDRATVNLRALCFFRQQFCIGAVNSYVFCFLTISKFALEQRVEMFLVFYCQQFCVGAVNTDKSHHKRLCLPSYSAAARMKLHGGPGRIQRKHR